jgi:N-dimethylarginine dimethylaminohydrolase
MTSFSQTKLAFNGHSMVGRLDRVLICSPWAAGWDDPSRISQWRELGFHHAPDFAVAVVQHDRLRLELKRAGAEIVELPESSEISLDAVYTHDASLATDFGLIAMRPGKKNRVVEGGKHGTFAAQIGIPTFGEIAAPGSSEAGDILWLDPKTLLIGHGYRTNAAGIEQLGKLLSPRGVDVLSAPLPYGAGPSQCLHLMSLISLLDEGTAIVDLPWLAVETVELLKARGFDFIEIDYAERDTLACNVLSLGEKRVLAIEENQQTNERLRAAGFDVRTFPGSEICINGSGGPTCLTRPLLRA